MNRAIKMAMLGGNYPNYLLPSKLITSETVYADFETTVGLSNSGGTLANDTTNFVHGTQSVKYTTPSGSSFYSVQTINKNLANDKSFRFCIYQYDNNLSYVDIQLSSVTNISKRFAYVFYPSAMNAIRPGWTFINIDKADFSNFGGEDWSNTMIRMNVTIGAAAGQVAEVSLDKFSVVSAEPAVMIMFDDGAQGLYNVAYPYMKQKKVVGTAYIISSIVGTGINITEPQLVEICNSGTFVAGNHLDNGDTLIGLSQADVQTKLATCKSYLDGLGLTAASGHVAYPGGAYDATVIAAMTAENMITGRTTNNRYRPILPYGEAYQIQNQSVVNTDSLATVKGWIDAAAAQDEILPLLFHDLVETPTIGTQWNISDFKAVIDYIRQVNIRTITIADYQTLASSELRIKHY